MIDYELLGKMFVTITKILISIGGFWGFVLTCHLFVEKKWYKIIIFIGIIIGSLWSFYTIWL